MAVAVRLALLDQQAQVPRHLDQLDPLVRLVPIQRFQAPQELQDRQVQLEQTLQFLGLLVRRVQPAPQGQTLQFQVQLVPLVQQDQPEQIAQLPDLPERRGQLDQRGHR